MAEAMEAIWGGQSRVLDASRSAKESNVEVYQPTWTTTCKRINTINYSDETITLHTTF